MEPLFIIVDLFCGAGGTTTGFDLAELEGKKIAKVIACVNHDHKAIESHWMNHPDVKHFEEDIRTLDLTENAYLVLWASLECTNFSKAKGGQPRDADSRTLADHLHRYIQAIDPDYIQIENVVEFMSWGPLDANGKPVSRKNGQDWMRWKNEICDYGYHTEWEELDSANFGAHTKRNRLFGAFAKHGLPIAWPEPTHTKNPSQFSLYSDLKKWNPVKDKLDFSDEGKSIFTRKRPLKERTLKVVYKGLVKALKEKHSNFIVSYYGNSHEPHSIENPSGTITTKDRFALFTILRDYISGYVSSVEEPLGAIPTVPKAHLVSFIVNPSHGGHTTSIEAPCPVIVARQDKAPLYLIRATMDANGISDIKMRMLRVDELLSIQGFPDGYKLTGNQKDQKKFIGNSVVPHVVKAWAEAMAMKIIHSKSLQVA